MVSFKVGCSNKKIFDVTGRVLSFDEFISYIDEQKLVDDVRHIVPLSDAKDTIIQLFQNGYEFIGNDRFARKVPYPKYHDKVNSMLSAYNEYAKARIKYNEVEFKLKCELKVLDVKRDLIVDKLKNNQDYIELMSIKASIRKASEELAVVTRKLNKYKWG